MSARPKGINAVAWFYSQSFHAETVKPDPEPEPKVCLHCGRRIGTTWGKPGICSDCLLADDQETTRGDMTE
jgi:hypothetical protein